MALIMLLCALCVASLRLCAKPLVGLRVGGVAPLCPTRVGPDLIRASARRCATAASARWLPRITSAATHGAAATDCIKFTPQSKIGPQTRRRPSNHRSGVSTKSPPQYAPMAGGHGCVPQPSAACFSSARRSSSARLIFCDCVLSWPQAAAISRPRGVRTGALMPAAKTMLEKLLIRSGVEHS